MAKWEDKLIQTGVLDVEGMDADLSKLAEARLKKDTGPRLGSVLWGTAARKLGIDRDKVREAMMGNRSVGGIAERIGVDFAKIRRMGTGSQWQALLEEKRKQDKITEEEAAKNAKVRPAVTAPRNGVFLGRVRCWPATCHASLPRVTTVVGPPLWDHRCVTTLV